jgi:hypothetical protein
MGTRMNGSLQKALLLGWVLAGCGEDEEDPVPTGPVLPIDAAVPIDANQPTADGATDASVPTGQCTGPNGCFSCRPTSNRELLNTCASGCVPFDNTKRLPGYVPGRLPPL